MSGVTLDGWWSRAADQSISLGQRVGSVDARLGTQARVAVELSPDQVLPTDSGYGRFVSRRASPESLAIEAATVTLLHSPAETCPSSSPIPVGVFLETLADCFEPGTDITIAGWRDVLDGLCGCGPIGYVEKPAWLTSMYGVGWLFSEPYEMYLLEYVTLFSPDEARLGADSGVRPTYMEVVGHFDDPAAASCRAIVNDSIDPQVAVSPAEANRITERLKVACADKFVATSVREVPAPQSALSFCPAGDPLTVSVAWGWGGPYALLTQVCYRGGNVAIRGWFDAYTDPGGEVPTVSPSWLDPFARPTLWSGEGVNWDTGAGFEVFVDPATDVALPTSPGWYTMTGHFDDPAAATCVRTDGANAGHSAAEECRNQFVVTDVAPAAP